jgi:hypothetical protein
MSLGFYHGNKKALLLDAATIAGVSIDPTRLEPGNSLPGGNGTWVKHEPAPDPTPMLLQQQIATDVGPTRMKREQATGMGYTGDQCDNCNSMRMKVTGHCNTCEECGTTTGCS